MDFDVLRLDCPRLFGNESAILMNIVGIPDKLKNLNMDSENVNKLCYSANFEATC